MLLSFIALLFTLILVVGVHEGGHALVANFFGVRIKTISLGFGKSLLTWRTKKGTPWIWALWPLGGYVRLLNSRITPVSEQEYPFCFDKKPVWVRILILVAGSLANFLMGWFFLILVFYIGIQYKIPLVQSVQNFSIAAQAGIKPGDQILSIEGHPTPSWQEVGMQTILLWGSKKVRFNLQEANSQVLKELNLDLSQPKNYAKARTLLAALGLKPNISARPNLLRADSLLQAIQQGSERFRDLLYFFIMSLKQVLTGSIPFSFLLGPLGMLATSIKTLQQGVTVFLFFIAAFNLAVGLVNLLPIPGLDGGSVLYGLIELIRGKPLSIALEVLLHRLILIVFCLLLVQLILNDLGRILQPLS